MTGHYVERNFGWDCHGIPIEFLVNKENNIKDMNQVYEVFYSMKKTKKIDGGCQLQ